MYPVIVWSCCYMNQISDVVWNIRKYNNVDMSDDKDVKSCKHCFLRRLQSLLERSRRFLVAIAVFTLQWCHTAEMSSFLRKQKTTRCGQNEQKKETNENYWGNWNPLFGYPKYHDLTILPIYLHIPGSVFCTQKSDFGLGTYLICH